MEEVPLNEEGYQTVAAQKSTPLMMKFIRRLVEDKRGAIKSEGGLSGFAPYYSGEKQVQSFQRLEEELHQFSDAGDSSWVWIPSADDGPYRPAVLQPLNEAGYSRVAGRKSNDEMKEYILKLLSFMNGVVVDDGGLNGVVPFYSGVRSVQSLETLKEELTRVMANPDGWAQLRDDHVPEGVGSDRLQVQWQAADQKMFGIPYTEKLARMFAWSTLCRPSELIRKLQQAEGEDIPMRFRIEGRQASHRCSGRQEAIAWLESLEARPSEKEAAALRQLLATFKQREVSDLKEALRECGGDADLATAHLLAHPPDIKADPEAFFSYYDVNHDGQLNMWELHEAVLNSDFGCQLDRNHVSNLLYDFYGDKEELNWESFMMKGGFKDILLANMDFEYDSGAEEEIGERIPMTAERFSLNVPMKLASDGVLGLFFAARVSGPWRRAAALLRRRYYSYRDRALPFEVLFISADPSEEVYNDHAKVMPWPKLPFNSRSVRRELAAALDIKAVPALVLVCGTGEICEDGLRLLEDDPHGDAFPWGLPVEEAQDLSDAASESAGGASDPASTMIKAVLRRKEARKSELSKAKQLEAVAMEVAQSVALTEDGYEKVAAYKSNFAMKAFAQRVVALKQWRVEDEAAFAALMWDYSDVRGKQSLGKLLKDLEHASWVWTGEDHAGDPLAEEIDEPFDDGLDVDIEDAERIAAQVTAEGRDGSSTIEVSVPTVDEWLASDIAQPSGGSSEPKAPEESKVCEEEQGPATEASEGGKGDKLATQEVVATQGSGYPEEGREAATVADQPQPSQTGTEDHPPASTPDEGSASTGGPAAATTTGKGPPQVPGKGGPVAPPAATGKGPTPPDAAGDGDPVLPSPPPSGPAAPGKGTAKGKGPALPADTAKGSTAPPVPSKGKGPPAPPVPGKGKGPPLPAPPVVGKGPPLPAGKGKGPLPPAGKGKGPPLPAGKGKGPPPPAGKGKGPPPPAGKGKGPPPPAGIGKGPPLGKGKGPVYLPGGKGGGGPTREEKTDWKGKKTPTLRWKRLLQSNIGWDASLFAHPCPEEELGHLEEDEEEEEDENTLSEEINEDALDKCFNAEHRAEVAEKKDVSKAESKPKKEILWLPTDKEGPASRRQNLAIMTKVLAQQVGPFLEYLRVFDVESIQADDSVDKGLLETFVETLLDPLLVTDVEWKRLQQSDAKEVYAWDDKLEGLFLMVHQIPRFEQRLKALRKVWQIERELPGLTDRLEEIHHSLEVVRASRVLQLAMEKVLHIGNCLNAGNESFGRADGFDAVLLLQMGKLNDTKGGVANTSVLHYLRDQELAPRARCEFHRLALALRNWRVPVTKEEVEAANAELDQHRADIGLLGRNLGGLERSASEAIRAAEAPASIAASAAGAGTTEVEGEALDLGVEIGRLKAFYSSLLERRAKVNALELSLGQITTELGELLQWLGYSSSKPYSPGMVLGHVAAFAQAVALENMPPKRRRTRRATTATSQVRPTTSTSESIGTDREQSCAGDVVGDASPGDAGTSAGRGGSEGEESVTETEEA